MIQAISSTNVILKKMVHKIIYYFNQWKDILNEMLVLVVVIIFITGSLNNGLMKELILLRHLDMKLHRNYYGTKARVKFNGSCLKQDKVTFNHGKVVSIYVFYEMSSNFNKSSYPTLENCLFGAVSLTKNADIDRNRYSRYGIGFDKHGLFHILVVDLAKM